MGDCRCCWLVVVLSALIWMDVAVVIAPVCCINGIWYRPWLSLTPMRMGLPLNVMSTSSSLNTLTPSFVKTETVSSLAILPMLIKEVGKSWNVSACIARAESSRNGNWVTYLALLVPPLATPTFCVDGCRMGRPALCQSFLLM
jgi:hypothetical protein